MTGDARLAGLFVYPVKGAGAIRPQAWDLDEFGLQHDRRWAVVDAGGRVITQRDYPRLALVRPTLTAAMLRLDAPGVSPLEVPVTGGDPRRLPVTVWRDEVIAEPCGPEANRWWTTLLGAPLHLVRMPEESRRPIEPSRAEPGGRVSFADAFPFLILSEASLSDLNARLAVAVPMTRFRPNLVVAGVPPYAEDTWHTVVIGSERLALAKACARCVVTTIDQETAGTGSEPLRTLAGYRRGAGGALFGQNAVHLTRGTVHIGDAVVPSTLR